MKPTIDEFLKIWPEDPNIQRCQAMMDVNRDLILTAPGSRKAHHAWRGGYADHVAQTMSLFLELYDISFLSGAIDSIPNDERFAQSEGIVVMFLHDIEKPWIYSVKDKTEWTKAKRKSFREKTFERAGFEFTPNQLNALEYVEGARDDQYVPGERPERPLAALCHAADFISARVMYNLHSIEYVTPPEELYPGSIE